MSLLQGAVPQTPNGTANPTATVAPVNREPKKPMTTVLSLLPKTTYKEDNGAEGTQDVLAYLQVQRSLLGYLSIRTADSLTPQQACHWTESILPDKKPRPQDALRLCYYMRSQSLDTYADVKDGFISLYVANPNIHIRGSRTDMLYWRQSIKTNEIVFRGVNAPVVVPDPARMADFYTLMNVPTTPRAHVPVRAASNVGPEGGHFVEELGEELEVDEEAVVDEEDEAQDEEDDGEEDEVQNDEEEHDGAAAQNTLAMQVEGAEANVYRLLASEPYDADAVNAALMQLEELNRHLHAE